MSYPIPELKLFSLALVIIAVLIPSFPLIVLHRRNLACIGCGSPRPGDRTPSPHDQPLNFNMQSSRLPSSPRFVAPLRPNTAGSSAPFLQSPNSPLQSPNPYANFGQASPFSQPQPSPHPLSAAKSPSPVHHLLTPSGRAFSEGGKVQNISTDPLSPCVMYWPDNEPFPEQGQIRPSTVMGVPVCSYGFFSDLNDLTNVRSFTATAYSKYW